MANEREDLLGLLDLHRTQDIDERRNLWRRGLASLAVVGARRPVPLEGLDPRALLASTRAAIDSDLVEELGWLSSSATALFDLMVSLPRSDEKRHLGRRILKTLHQCDAHTFVALAIALATTSPKVLAGPHAHSRVAICLELPQGDEPKVDALALALISRPDLVSDWLVKPSSGGLAQRRSAARLLERAAREALRKSGDGNQIGLRVFQSNGVREAWKRLLHDRESLAWKHVAAARGVLVDLIPEFDEEIRSEISDGDLRRASASLCASIATRPETAPAECLELLASPLVKDDPGIAGAMLFGAVSAAAFEPDATEELLTSAARTGGIECSEVIVAIRREHVRQGFADDAAAIVTRSLEQLLKSSDDGISAMSQALLDELKSTTAAVPPLFQNVQRAMDCYTRSGPEAAVQATEDALKAASETLRLLQEAKGDQSGRRVMVSALGEIDRGLLQTSALSHLVQITHRRVSDDSLSLDRIREGLHTWLLDFESQPVSSPEIEHLTWRIARLRTLIHLVDVDDADDKKSDELRTRREHIVSIFRQRVQYDCDSKLRRMVIVTLARACDASIREEWFELSDLLLGILPDLGSHEVLQIFAEASLVPEVEAITEAYAELLQSDAGALQQIDSLESLIAAFPWAGSPRVEALRAALLDISASLRDLLAAGCRTELATNQQNSPLADLASACQWLAQLTNGARRRLDIADPEASPFIGKALRTLDLEFQDSTDLAGDCAGCAALVDDELPKGISTVVIYALEALGKFPVNRDLTAIAPEPGPIVAARSCRRLKTAPVERNISGYYLLHAVGDGGAGSVFLACRVEDRHRAEPEIFALKRPQFNGQHAQVLSEEEFFDLFRQEAGTLLSLPPHKNLAGFVTFDLGAKPEPVLVMEYIQGPSLARLMEAGELRVNQAFKLLDGIAAGLQAMHELEIGHLDIKPENIIVRDQDPVLVDFGLAGRRFRPGCATVHYGAPEVIVGENRGPAMPADVYSFACLAFEMLVGQPLFMSESLKGFVQAHFSHDGNPPALVALAKHGPGLPALTQALARCLRQDANQRTGISVIRADLKKLGSSDQVCSALSSYGSSD